MVDCAIRVSTWDHGLAVFRLMLWDGLRWCGGNWSMCVRGEKFFRSRSKSWVKTKPVVPPRVMQHSKGERCSAILKAACISILIGQMLLRRLCFQVTHFSTRGRVVSVLNTMFLQHILATEAVITKVVLKYSFNLLLLLITYISILLLAVKLG